MGGAINPKCSISYAAPASIFRSQTLGKRDFSGSPTIHRVSRIECEDQTAPRAERFLRQRNRNPAANTLARSGSVPGIGVGDGKPGGAGLLPCSKTPAPLQVGHGESSRVTVTAHESPLYEITPPGASKVVINSSDKVMSLLWT